jgi:general L-amino acid transport system permease protein
MSAQPYPRPLGNNFRVRSAAVQLAIVLAVVAGVVWLFGNVQANLAARSIASGFDFFVDAAGFAIGETPIAYSPSDTFARAILVGLLNTLKVSALAIFGATLLGFALGLARLSANPVLRGPARIYIELVRNVPLLLQLLVLYAALLMGLPAIDDAWQPVAGIIVSNRGIAIPNLISAPTITRFNVVGGWQLSTELVTLVCGLSLYSAAYIAEIVRAGLLSVPVGQREAALCLGLTPVQTFKRVVLPQALRAMLPPLGGWYLNTVKNSSLAVAVAYPDLVSVVDTLINQTGQAIEGVAIIIAAFLSINLTISTLLGIYNARLNRIPPAVGLTRQSAGRLTGAASIRRSFSKPSRALVSSLLIAIGAYIGWRLVDWLVVSAAFTGGAETCRRVTGACWPFIAENHRLILFGVYPADEQWRAVLVLVLFIGLVAASFFQRLWNVRLAWLWLLGLLAMVVLMGGGLFGLTPVATDKWSGLPLTVALASTAVLAGFPLAILLALARRSHVSVARVLATSFIELMRGTPLVGLLFMAAVMFPLLLPPAFEVDSFARVQIALVLFTAAYMAESIRAGLQALPSGQVEAATSLGLTYLQTLRHVILPQALRTSLPSLVNTSISEVKNTTLVLIVGMFDLLQTTRLALVDVEWRPYFVEAYGFTAAVFFVICFAMSQLSRRIERQWAAPTPARPS